MGPNRRDVLAANVALHTHLAPVYVETEPHYRPENRARVDKILGELASQHDRGVLLDLGCGMGFLIDLAKKHFRRVIGVDVTEAMIRKVDRTADFGEVALHMAEIENLPLRDGVCDVVTAFAVIHHLHSLEPAFREVFRVLKPGGGFYSDTDPNYYFWEAMKGLPEGADYSAIVSREISAVREKDHELEKKFGVPAHVLNVAEILKHDGGGFKAEDLVDLLKSIGFSRVEVKYEWFLGEARVIHSENMQGCAEPIRSLLHEMLPLTRHLFKYVRIMAVK